MKLFYIETYVTIAFATLLVLSVLAVATILTDPICAESNLTNEERVALCQ